MHRMHPRLLVAVVASAAVAATAAATAGAAADAARATAYDCTNFSAFSLLTSHAGLAARGDDATKEPTLNAVTDALPTSERGKGSRNWKTVTVPVWFHVVHDGATGNVTDTQIADQMRVLNLGFSGFFGGYDHGFRFRLAGITRTDNAGWFSGGIDGSSERPMKRALHRGGWDTLNIYSTTAGAYLGWAYLPGLTDSLQYLDGVVIDWASMVETSTTYEGRYDLGMTAVHEVGHWLGLEHTFYGGCNANGDFVDDTPPMKVPTSGCPAGKDTCTREPGLDPIHNYMDYSYDSCYTEFTRGQAARSQDHWVYFRANGGTTAN